MRILSFFFHIFGNYSLEIPVPEPSANPAGDAIEYGLMHWAI